MLTPHPPPHSNPSLHLLSLLPPDSGKNLNYFSHDGPVYGLSVDRTSSNLFSVATEHGEILVYDLRAGKTEPLAIAKFRTPFNAVEFHPLNGNFLATANAKRGAQLWDLRHHTQ